MHVELTPQRCEAVVSPGRRALGIIHSDRKEGPGYGGGVERVQVVVDHCQRSGQEGQLAAFGGDDDGKKFESYARAQKNKPPLQLLTLLLYIYFSLLQQRNNNHKYNLL
jgi:hypothetical protein